MKRCCQSGLSKIITRFLYFFSNLDYREYFSIYSYRNRLYRVLPTTTTFQTYTLLKKRARGEKKEKYSVVEIQVLLVPVQVSESVQISYNTVRKSRGTGRGVYKNLVSEENERDHYTCCCEMQLINPKKFVV